jgi:two-component system, NarL family, nitrate/nitrite response regulator NarL
MPGMAGGAGIARLAAHANGAPVAIVSGEPAHATAAHVRKLGAVGFVSKSLRPPLLRAAILLIAEGGTFFPDAPQGQAPETSAAAQFTDRELAILKAIAVGKSNKQIAAQTQVQEVTIKAHITRILAKTGLSNRVQIALYAVKNGLDS